MSAYWIVVANASRARIFEAAQTDSAINEIMDLAWPESRLHAGDLVSDKAGHVLNARTGGHSIDRDQPAKQRQELEFAHAICAHLEHARAEHKFRKLYLIAPPHFLGTIRKQMSKPLSNVLKVEINKDLTLADPAQVQAQFGQA